MHTTLRENTTKQFQVNNYNTKNPKNQLINTKGLKKLRTSQNIKEIGGAVGFDAAVNTGMEYIYQSGLIQTGVRENLDKFSLGYMPAAAWHSRMFLTPFH